MFAHKGETLTEYWDFTHRIFEFGAKGTEGEGPNMILDDGGDATLLMILGQKAEKDQSVIGNPTSEEETCLYAARSRPSSRSTRPGTPARPRRSSA